MTGLIDGERGILHRRRERGDKVISERAQHRLLLVAGAVFLLAALWLVIPVSVNLPASWPGGLLVILFAAIGVVLVRRSIRR